MYEAEKGGSNDPYMYFLGWRPLLLGRRPSLLGWRPLLLGWRSLLLYRLEAIAVKVMCVFSCQKKKYLL